MTQIVEVGDRVDVHVASARRSPGRRDPTLKTLSQNLEVLSTGREFAKDRGNALITGGTGSGKTPLLNVSSAHIGRHELIVTIEDTAELRLHQEHVSKMETRPPNIEGDGPISKRQLVINSLRMRPDRIILGEVRGGEALDMLQTMNTGHADSLATSHANSCSDAVHRLEMMVAPANSNISIQSIRRQIASAIDIFVQFARLSDSSRRVIEVLESGGIDEEGSVKIVPRFLFDQRAGAFRAVESSEEQS